MSARKRKPVEADMSPSLPRGSATKALSAEQGPGSKLTETEDERQATGLGKRKASQRETAEKEMKEMSAVDTEGTPLRKSARKLAPVRRYNPQSTSRGSRAKALSIEKVPGMKLQDIPNVSYNLSNPRDDEDFQMLHEILFGKKSNPDVSKRNLLKFSGFIGTKNEAKKRTKVKEALNKCVKSKLFHFCELLDIPVKKKSSTKKENISSKLLKFLESPSTRDVVPAATEEKTRAKTEMKKGGMQFADAEREEDEDDSAKMSLDEEDNSPSEESDHENSESEEEEGEADENDSANPTEVPSDEEDNGDSENGSDDQGSETEDEVDEQDEGGSANDEEHDDESESEEHDDDEPENKIEDEENEINEDETSSEKEDNDDPEKESDQEKSETEDEEDKQEEPSSRKRYSAQKQMKKAAVPKIKKKASPVKKYSHAKSDSKGSKVIRKEKGAPTKNTSKSSRKKSAPVDNRDSGPASTSKSTSKGKTSMSRSKRSSKDQGKDKAIENAIVRLNEEELDSVVSVVMEVAVEEAVKHLKAFCNADLKDKIIDVISGSYAR